MPYLDEKKKSTWYANNRERLAKVERDKYRDKVMAETGMDVGSKKGWIYFVECIETGRMKIGFTTGIKKRMQSMQTCSPTPLVVFGAVMGTKDGEREMQAMFSDLSMRGEWFDDSHGEIKQLAMEYVENDSNE